MSVLFCLYQASLTVCQKKRPVLVVKDENVTPPPTEEEDLSALDIENLIEERDSLYRKAMDTKGSHMQVRSTILKL